MTRKKKMITTPVEIGDVIVMRDWNDQWVTLRVQKISDSKVHSDTVEGMDTEKSQYRALPLSHKIETARAHSEGRGKWIVELPDGTTERAKSKGAAQELCSERGVFFQEV